MFLAKNAKIAKHSPSFNAEKLIPCIWLCGFQTLSFFNSHIEPNKNGCGLAKYAKGAKSFHNAKSGGFIRNHRFLQLQLAFRLLVTWHTRHWLRAEIEYFQS
jgi:hypothetical protein